MSSVLITGVCGGLGKAIATRLSGDGWVVYGTDIVERPPDIPLEKFWKGDVSKESFWGDVVMPGLCDEVPLNAFIHNAAVQPCSPIVDTTVEEWDQTLAVNLRAAFLGTRNLVPLMTGDDASIVNISSVHAFATSAGMSAYVASKGGLLAFTRAAAIELADQGIRVNAVLPGAVDTPMLEAGLKRSLGGSAAARKNLEDRTPLGKVARPKAISGAVAFLLDSSQSSFVTGQTLVVDGGVLARLSSE